MDLYNSDTPQLSNFSEYRLAQPVGVADTTLMFTSLDGFPALASPLDYVPMVLRDATTYREVVHVTAVDRAAKTLTVLRGQEGFAGRAWSTSAYAYITLTEGAARDMLSNTWRRPKDVSGNILVPTRVDAQTVTLPGDQTGLVAINCALRIFQDGAPIQASIYVNNSVYDSASGLTTITMDSAVLSSTDPITLLEVSPRPNEIPKHIFVADQATLLATLGLVVGRDVQAYDPKLQSFSALAPSADTLPYFTGGASTALAYFTQLARAVLACADPATLRAVVGAQAADTTLSGLAALATAADQMIYATGIDSFAMSALTAFARVLLAAADAPTARAVLGAQAYDAYTAKWNVVGAYTKQQYTPPPQVTPVNGIVQLDADANPEVFTSALTAATTFPSPTSVARGKTITISIYSDTAQPLSWGSGWAKSYDIALPSQALAGHWLTLYFKCIDGALMTLIGTSATA